MKAEIKASDIANYDVNRYAGKSTMPAYLYQVNDQFKSYFTEKFGDGTNNAFCVKVPNPNGYGFTYHFPKWSDVPEYKEYVLRKWHAELNEREQPAPFIEFPQLHTRLESLEYTEIEVLSSEGYSNDLGRAGHTYRVRLSEPKQQIDESYEDFISNLCDLHKVRFDI